MPGLPYLVFPFLSSKARRRTIKRLLVYLSKCNLYDEKTGTWTTRPGSEDAGDIENKMADWLEEISSKCHEFLNETNKLGN